MNFLKTAQGSLKELETHLILCQRLKFSAVDAVEALLSRCELVGKMLLGLIRNVQSAGEV